MLYNEVQCPSQILPSYMFAPHRRLSATQVTSPIQNVLHPALISSNTEKKKTAVRLIVIVSRVFLSLSNKMN